MTNECGYSYEWQDYTGCYDKFEYDIILKETGVEVLNCYPNAGKFNSIKNHYIQGEEIAKIRFSHTSRWYINLPEGFEEKTKEIEKERDLYQKNRQTERIKAFEKQSQEDGSIIYNNDKAINYLGFHNTVSLKRGKRVDVRTEPKINRNSICKCGSGKKYKKCCQN